ncbi:hypothetical protein [Nocardia pneumoniae]|uniref:hypothetical protein n=1 Tax=Nocardia pneumoniae TaxID=228601 RepID=UPI00031DB01D|nr:hypothetical protein [Nocardia pneumoniae]
MPGFARVNGFPVDDRPDGMPVEGLVVAHDVLGGVFVLIDRIAPAPAARIVTVTSVTHRRARMDLDFALRRYRYMTAYGQSERANLLFTFELQRRRPQSWAAAVAIAAHPGSAQTAFSSHMDRRCRRLNAAALLKPFTTRLQQPPADGALPTLRAATAPDVRGGDLYGPSRFFGSKRDPMSIRAARSALDGEVYASCGWSANDGPGSCFRCAPDRAPEAQRSVRS